ncbi:MAG: histidinol-phosphate transaminase [bacterium]
MDRFTRRSVSRMQGYVPGEQSRAPGIIKLNTNENPYPPSPMVAKALQALPVEELRLYPEPTALEVRKRIAAIHGCDIDSVFVGNGSDEILALCTRAFVEDDGDIGFFNPSYSLYPVLALIRNVATKPVELSADFSWRMPKAYKTSLFFMTNPNAPTGMLHDRSTVGRFCRQLRGVTVIDEAYVDFAREDCMDMALRYNNVLVVRTLSKAFSLAGLRVGYAVGAKPLIAALFKLKDSYNTDTIAQRLALAALSDLHHMKANVRKIRQTRARLSRLLVERGAFVFPSETNFLWLRPPAVPAEVFCKRLRERQIMIRYFCGPRTADFVRITVGTDEQVDRLIEAIDEMGLVGVPSPRGLAVKRKGCR